VKITHTHEKLLYFPDGGCTHLTPLVWVCRYEVDLSGLASRSRALKSVSQLITI